MLILFLGLILLVLFTFYVRLCYFGRQLSRIPGPRSLPLVGNGLQTLGLDAASAFAFIRELNKKYKSINKLWSFSIGSVNITDPNYAEKLLSSQRYTTKEKPYTFLRNWLGEGLLTSNGEKWKHRRKLLTPAFNFTVLRRFQDVFNDRTEQMLSRIQLETANERTDVLPMVCRLTLEIMCETSMGISVKKEFEMVARKYFSAIHQYGKIIQQRLMKVWLHVDWIFKLTPLGRHEEKLVGDMQSLTSKIIEERKAGSSFVGEKEERRSAMLDLLLENEKEGKIDLNGIREEVDTFLFAGHDTTAVALCFMIMRIANEPQIQDQIYEELEGIFGETSRPPTMEDLSKMKFLECCIKESLRLYPSAPILARYVIEDIDLGKYIIPKGAITFIHVFDLHRDPETYPDPERFDPDRFLPERSATRHPYSYIPFGAGPRNCIGQKFAMLELKTVISGLLRRFKLDPVTTPKDINYVAEIVLRSSSPVYVKFRNRKKYF